MPEKSLSVKRGKDKSLGDRLKRKSPLRRPLKGTRPTATEEEGCRKGTEGGTNRPGLIWWESAAKRKIKTVSEEGKTSLNQTKKTVKGRKIAGRGQKRGDTRFLSSH